MRHPLRILMNAGPWLPVPPDGYGGIEQLVAFLVPELRRRGHRVVLCTVDESTVEADERHATYATGQFRTLATPYNRAAGVAHAHMQQVVARLRSGPPVDLVHDHLEVVGASVLGACGPPAPPVLHTLHWDLSKHPEFYERFDGGGRVFFSAISPPQLERAPENLRRQTLGTVNLAVDLATYPFHAAKDDHFVVLSRITEVKGVDTAARLCKELGVKLRIAGPVAGYPTPAQLEDALADPAAGVRELDDVRYYHDAVRVFEDGERVTWIGSVSGRAKEQLVGRARALLLPIRWTEPGGTAAIEALAYGTPVVALRRGVLPDIVQHGVNGFLADDEREFADWMLRVGELDPQACRDSVRDRYSVAAVTDAYLHLYEEVLTRAAAG